MLPEAARRRRSIRRSRILFYLTENGRNSITGTTGVNMTGWQRVISDTKIWMQMESCKQINARKQEKTVSYGGITGVQKKYTFLNTFFWYKIPSEYTKNTINFYCILVDIVVE